MRKFIEYALLCGCILALSACQEKIDPVESGLADGAEISFSIGAQAVGTKGLINPTSSTDPGLAVQGTQLHVYDYLTGFTGTVGTTDHSGEEFAYIDGTLEYVNTTAGVKDENYWQFVGTGVPAFYRWTKTGTHTFFGWLSKSPTDEYTQWQWNETVDNATVTKTVAPSWTEGSKTLSITDLVMTPATTQFDFLYSNIEVRNMADAGTAKYATVPFRMKHIFTALEVYVVNETEEPLTNFSLKFTKFHPKQSATINWATPEEETVGTEVYSYPKVTWTPDLNAQDATDAKDMVIVSSFASSIPVGETTPLFSGTDGAGRLLWPQKILPSTPAVGTTPAVIGSQAVISYEGSGARAANLSDLKDATGQASFTQFEAGKKYILTITVKPLVVLFNIIVNDLENVNADSQSTETFYVES